MKFCSIRAHRNNGIRHSHTNTHRGQTTKWHCVNRNDKQNTKNYGCSHSTSTLLYAVAMESRMIHTGPVTNTLERLFSLVDSNFCAMIDKKKENADCWLIYIWFSWYSQMQFTSINRLLWFPDELSRSIVEIRLSYSFNTCNVHCIILVAFIDHPICIVIVTRSILHECAANRMRLLRMDRNWPARPRPTTSLKNLYSDILSVRWKFYCRTQGVATNQKRLQFIDYASAMPSAAVNVGTFAQDGRRQCDDGRKSMTHRYLAPRPPYSVRLLSTGSTWSPPICAQHTQEASTRWPKPDKTLPHMSSYRVHIYHAQFMPVTRVVSLTMCFATNAQNDRSFSPAALKKATE